MLNIIPGIDPERKIIFLRITGGSLLTKYKDEYKEMILNEISEELEDSSLDKVEDGQLLFSFKARENDVKPDSFGTSVGIGDRIQIILKEFRAISERFLQKAVATEFKYLEFIPLEGYPFEKLKDDLKPAIEGKRSLCIISDFKYMNMVETAIERGGYIFPQYTIPYGSDEYYDVFCMILAGEKEELKKYAEPRMKDIQWY